VVAGCGSERLGKREYLDRLRVIESGAQARDAVRLFDSVVVDPPLARPECAAKLAELEGRLDEIVSDVDELRPPRDVQKLQDEFVEAARDSISMVGKASDDARSGQLSCGRPVNRRIYGLESTQRAREVLQELGRKGYILGLNSQD
jgi:hypothetical protein